MYKATQTRIQTYLNDVAGVRIVCAFIDDIAASPGRIFTKQQLMDEVWGYETEADPHTIEVHIGRIRERLKDNPDFEIVTMRGIGYKVVKK